MASTPHNTPRERSLELAPSSAHALDFTIPLINNNVQNAKHLNLEHHTVGKPSGAVDGLDSVIGVRSSPLRKRIGGGYDTTAIGLSLLSEEERRAKEWRAMGAGMGGDGAYNPDLDKFLMERKTDVLAANSFLFDRKTLSATQTGSGIAPPQIFEFSKASAVAHHLSAQPDHYSRWGPAATSPSSSLALSRQANSSSAGGRSHRILNRFESSNSNPYNSHTYGGGGAINRFFDMSAIPHHRYAEDGGGGGIGGGGGPQAIYLPYTGFQPLVPVSQLNAAAGTDGGTAVSGGVDRLSASGATATPLRVASPLVAGILHPTARVHNDTTLHVISAAPTVGASGSPLARRQQPSHNTNREREGESPLGFPCANAATAVAEASGALSSYLHQTNTNISRHTASSKGKISSPDHGSPLRVGQSVRPSTAPEVLEISHSHPHSYAYIAAKQYEDHVRAEAAGARGGAPLVVSSIEHTDAMLDALASGEPRPSTGYVQPPEMRSNHSSTLRVLKNSHHIVDRSVGRHGVRLACCGGGSGGGSSAALVPASGTKVEGLFVTYCQQDVHSRLADAERELIHAHGQREAEAEAFEVKLATALRENAQLREALRNATLVAENKLERMEQSVRDSVALKEEYDRRAQNAKKELEETLANRSNEREQIASLQTACEEKDKKIVGLEVQIFDLKRNLAVAEKQVQDVYKATALATEEKVAAEGRADQLQKQIRELGVTLMNADKAYQSAEYGRRFAEDKISHMAFLMSTGQQRVSSTKVRK